MLSASVFVGSALRRGFSTWTGVPCSYLQPFINYVMVDPSVRYVAATNEADAISIAAGTEVGGGKAVAMFQNSGLGNAVNPLTSLTHPHRIPMLVITTLRGEPNGAPDEPQHELMGSITTDLLELMSVPWEYFPTNEEDVEPCLERASTWMEAEKRPYALVMRKDSVAPEPAPPLFEVRSRVASPLFERPEATATRGDMIAAVQSSMTSRDLLLATTGYTGREMYEMQDGSNELALVGAMGCASSFALGLSLQRPDLRVIVLDGDGAALMRLGALPTIGYHHPANLLHIVLDNGMHESTGGQSTVSSSIDLAGIALSAGYADARVISEPKELSAVIDEHRPGPLFVRAVILPGIPANLGRPKIAPSDTTQRFREHISALANVE